MYNFNFFKIINFKNKKQPRLKNIIKIKKADVINTFILNNWWQIFILLIFWRKLKCNNIYK